ncbi:MAG: hypothetical protein GY941_21460 [Planctomycetes bacterium]|nr:hypothetical protein [Planctomycetota bacterium]
MLTTERKKQTMAKHKKAAQLERLARWVDLETGKVLPDAFEWERKLYDKAVRMKRMNKKLKACKRCKGLNCPGSTEVCPSWGNLNAEVAIVGQSAHRYAVKSDMPFIQQSGDFLDAACRLSNIRRDRLFITNVLHCCSERNRASKEVWKDHCREWLATELQIVNPEIVVCLGNDAKYVVGKIWTGKAVAMVHPAAFLHSSSGSELIVDWVIKLSNVIDKHIDTVD